MTEVSPHAMNAGHRLLVNADDFGLHPDINRAIAEGVEAGRIQSLSVSVNGKAVDWELLARLRDRGARIGVHLTWVGEPWLTDGTLLPAWPTLLVGLIGRPGLVRRAYAEARAQVSVFGARGWVPAHLDSHQHVHICSGLWTATRELADEFKVPRIRVPWSPSWRGVRWSPGGIVRQALGAWRHYQIPGALPCIGLAVSGRYEHVRLAVELHAARGQEVEVVVHPGYGTPALQQQYGAWHYDWDAERRMLMSPEWPALLAVTGFCQEKMG